MKKTTRFIALILTLPLLMAMDAPMEQVSSSRKKTFSVMQETNTQEETTPEPPFKRHRGDFFSSIEQSSHNFLSGCKKVLDYLWSWLTPSPHPALPLDLWRSIYQIAPENSLNLLLVCKELHNYLWSFRTNVRLCAHSSDNTLRFVADVCPNLTTLTLSNDCHHNLLYHMSYYYKVDENVPGRNLLLFTNLQSLSLRRKGDVSGEVISKLTNLNHLELPIVGYKKVYKPFNFRDKHSEVSFDYYHTLKEDILSLPQLNKLGLGSLPFNNDDMSELQFLESLSLDANLTITDLGIEKMTNLTFLDLGSNKKITHKGLRPLTKLTQLKLYPYANYRVYLKELTTLTHLQQLNLYYLYCRDTEIGFLQKAMPHLRIESWGQ